MKQERTEGLCSHATRLDKKLPRIQLLAKNSALRSLLAIGIIVALSRLFVRFIPIHQVIEADFPLRFTLSIVYCLLIAVPLGWFAVIQPLLNEARNETKNFLTLVEVAPEGVLVVNGDGRIKIVNKESEKLFGYSRQEMLGLEVERLIPARFDDRHRQLRKNYMTNPYTRPMSSGLDLAALRKDGSEFPVSVSISQMSYKGTPLVICIVRDVTAQRKARAEALAANHKLTQSLRMLQQWSEATERISNFSELLHACRNVDEAAAVISRFFQTSFPDQKGTLYLATASRNALEKVVSWGFPSDNVREVLPMDSCWAVRRGRPHGIDDTYCDACLSQGGSDGNEDKLCVPMIAQGELVGVFQVCEQRPRDPSEGSEGQTPAALNAPRIGAIAERISSAIANLKLRAALREQAIRDPLMGLYNRRFLEECLERELLRALRGGRSLTLLMLDVDHFKRFNDLQGHNAGDVVLSQIGNLLRGRFRGGDIPCRFGGEELAVLLPECSLEAGRARAEEVRKAVEALTVIHEGHSLGAITISIGIASVPEHGNTAEELVRAADMALYDAKKRGRNQVIAATAVPSELLARISHQ